ncbi:hypothetical protein A9G13_00655 [Gilliamella sp. wkB178]|uniref:hypothetical protein n=1 Tax=Gilliamella sp. wkB178 TaxID=3120259 RepID=UPI00080E886F|nr:hypothetical protein [Gilliamella apicola]OCG10283.1 hypothetical protein A9G13_00655 [Gilliamella apicola]
MPYATTTQALSATTSEVINGSAPYLTFDNGVTKVTTSDDLLGITLSDGTHITPATNTSTAANPIQLTVANQSFADIGMLVPTTTNSIALSALIGAPYNYWGDDDGDGQGVNGITATGNLSIAITDKLNQTVSRSASLDICHAPYKVELTSTAGSLTTQYGVPNSSSFNGSTATYYISPKAAPTICYARPNLKRGSNNDSDYPGWNFEGPTTIWSKDNGFLMQSIEPSSYDRNFPTTGANKLYFDLLVGGIDAATLTWPDVTQGGITVTMALNPPKDDYFNPDGASSVRVTLTGPAATSSQSSSKSPGTIDTPALPQTFELVGYDSSHRKVLSYGFVLKHWFVKRGHKIDSVANHTSWCSKLGSYRFPKVKDLTNSVCSGNGTSGSSCEGSVGATPSSNGNHYQRNIGAGFFTEWGDMFTYAAADFNNLYVYWTSDSASSTDHYYVGWSNGNVDSFTTGYGSGLCVYP